MVSLVFHGGHSKTGTSSVQTVLRAKEVALRAAGILYPAPPEGNRFGKLQHADVVISCAEGKFEQVARYLDQIVAEAKAAGCDRVLLSSEFSTSFYLYPARFREWVGLAERVFDDIRYVFLVRGIVGFAISMYRELLKTSHASFNYEIVHGILLDRLVEQQKAIAFYRDWDADRVSYLSFKALAADRLVHRTVKELTGFEIAPEDEAHVNSSVKKSQNMASLLLNDVYALVGAHMGLYPMSAEVRGLVDGAVQRGNLKRAFDDMFALRLRQAYLEVTEKHVRRAYEENRATIERSREGLPEDLIGCLFDEATSVEVP